MSVYPPTIAEAAARRYRDDPTFRTFVDALSALLGATAPLSDIDVAAALHLAIEQQRRAPIVP